MAFTMITLNTGSGGYTHADGTAARARIVAEPVGQIEQRPNCTGAASRHVQPFVIERLAMQNEQ